MNAEIFAQVGRGLILKRARVAQTPSRALLWREWLWHVKIEEAVSAAFQYPAVLLPTTDGGDAGKEGNEKGGMMTPAAAAVSVPKPKHYIPAESVEWWNENLIRWSFQDDRLKFPEDCIEAEQIRPLNGVIRDALMQRYCPAGIRDAVQRNVENRDCLARVYLGYRRKHVLADEEVYFSLRNFELDLARAEDLGLADEMRVHARGMGIALACMHWVARTDARGVEFVLGAPPAEAKIDAAQCAELPVRACTREYASRTQTHRAVRLWLLDFDKCGPLEMSVAGVTKAADAFWRNDPFYPRPVAGEGEQDYAYWKAFRDAYLHECEKCASQEVKSQRLPELFVDMLLERATKGTECELPPPSSVRCGVVPKMPRSLLPLRVF
jgi:hypothetical protein